MVSWRAEDGEQRADIDVALERQPKRQAGSHPVDVAAAPAFAVDVSRPGEIGDEALGRALGDLQAGGEVADADLTVLRNQEQGLGVIRQEGELGCAGQFVLRGREVSRS